MPKYKFHPGSPPADYVPIPEGVVNLGNGSSFQILCHRLDVLALRMEMLFKVATAYPESRELRPFVIPKDLEFGCPAPALDEANTPARRVDEIVSAAFDKAIRMVKMAPPGKKIDDMEAQILMWNGAFFTLIPLAESILGCFGLDQDFRAMTEELIGTTPEQIDSVVNTLPRYAPDQPLTGTTFATKQTRKTSRAEQESVARLRLLMILQRCYSLSKRCRVPHALVEHYTKLVLGDEAFQEMLSPDRICHFMGLRTGLRRRSPRRRWPRFPAGRWL